jgi:hypothetical protein
MIPEIDYRLTNICLFVCFFQFRFLFFFVHLFTCEYIVWVISPPWPPHLPFSSLPSSVPGRSCSAFITNFVKEKTQANKEDKAFLLVELRIAIQKYS